MALLSPQIERFILTKLPSSNLGIKSNSRCGHIVPVRAARSQQQCSAIAIDAPSSSLTDVAGIRWGCASLQGPREEMEDYVVIRSDGLDGFSFAAVFDGHAGFSSVKFLRDELYRECVAALQGGLVLNGKDFNAIRKALIGAFQNVDIKLLNWLEMTGEDKESGSTATVMFTGNDMLVISHIGDSSVVLSRSGKPEVLTAPHRPYGSNRVSLHEIRRIREAGGWIVNGRICGNIAVSRAFGDVPFKTKKDGMLQKGVEEGKWSEKFSSRVNFNGDLVIASPDVYQIALGSDAEFIVLASDGLWDYINSSDTINFVRNQLRQHGDVQVACENLAEAALVMSLMTCMDNFSYIDSMIDYFGSSNRLNLLILQDQRSQDNVSIVIADLGYGAVSHCVAKRDYQLSWLNRFNWTRRTDWQNLPLQEQSFVYELGQALATIGIVSLGIWMTAQLSL